MYILIMILIVSGGHSATSTTVEFRSLPACRAAAAEMTVQVKKDGRGDVLAIACASKGE